MIKSNLLLCIDLINLRSSFDEVSPPLPALLTLNCISLLMASESKRWWTYVPLIPEKCVPKGSVVDPPSTSISTSRLLPIVDGNTSVAEILLYLRVLVFWFFWNSFSWCEFPTLGWNTCCQSLGIVLLSSCLSLSVELIRVTSLSSWMIIDAPTSIRMIPEARTRTLMRTVLVSFLALRAPSYFSRT